MSNLLIKNANIISLGDMPYIKENQSILIKNGLIENISSSIINNDKDIEIFDAKGMYLLPGFVNAHTHAYSALVRGFSKAKEALTFQQQLENLWWKLDKALSLEDCYYSTMVLALDSIKHGTTTVIDHHASPFSVTGSLAQLKKAFKETGLRASLCYELSDRDGEKISEEGIKENISMIDECKKEKSDFFSAMFGLHASFSINDKTFEKINNLLDNNFADNTGFHIHIAEAESDQLSTLKSTNKRVVQRLNEFNILGKKTIAAHCIHLNDDETDILKDNDCMIVHNPQSNLNNAVGILNTLKIAKKDILCGIGTDAMTTNMLEELRVALFAQHLNQKHPTSAFIETVNLLFKNNYEIANRLFNINLGKIERGYKADFALFDYTPPTPFDMSSLYGHLLYGLSQIPVDTTIVNGKILMKNRVLTLDIDEKEILHKSREYTKKMWKRIEETL